MGVKVQKDVIHCFDTSERVRNGQVVVGTNPETIEIHLNTEMKTVFADGLSTEDYFDMIDNMLAILCSMAAAGLWKR